MLRRTSPEQRAVDTALVATAETNELERLQVLARLISNESIERHLEVMEALGQITRTQTPPSDD